MLSQHDISFAILWQCLGNVLLETPVQYTNNGFVWYISLFLFHRLTDVQSNLDTCMPVSEGFLSCKLCCAGLLLGKFGLQWIGCNSAACFKNVSRYYIYLICCVCMSKYLTLCSCLNGVSVKSLLSVSLNKCLYIHVFSQKNRSSNQKKKLKVI